MRQIEILDVLRRHITMIIGVSIVATLAGYAFSFAMPDRYTVTALVLVRPEQPVKLGTEKENKEFLNFPMGYASAVETASKTYIQIIKSPALLGQVVTELGLDKEKERDAGGSGKFTRFLPGFLQPIGQGLKSSLNGLMAMLKYGRVIKDDPFTEAVKEVSDGLSLDAHLDTYLFDIKYTARDPQRAADVANMTASKLVQFVDDMRLSETGLQGGHLKSELEQTRLRLDATRARLESFKMAHSVFLPNTEYDSKLKVIGELEVELAKTDATLVSSQNTLSTVSMKARRARLVQSLQELQAELVPLPGIERELSQLEQDVKDALTAYEVVDKEFRQADINRSASVPEVQSVSEAIAPRLPSSPLRGTIALASFIGGLVIAVTLGFFLEYRNRRVRGINDVEEFVGVKVLATIPRIALNRWRLVYRM
jgi:uncharacterized protein involved in exopolysaccharide biosynthesis